MKVYVLMQDNSPIWNGEVRLESREVYAATANLERKVVSGRA